MCICVCVARDHTQGQDLEQPRQLLSHQVPFLFLLFSLDRRHCVVQTGLDLMILLAQLFSVTMPSPLKIYVFS